MSVRKGGGPVAAQDFNGVPITPFQDPLHYPHGTKFLAPGGPLPYTSLLPLVPQMLGLLGCAVLLVPFA